MDRVASGSYLFDRNNGREPEGPANVSMGGGYGPGIKIKRSTSRGYDARRYISVSPITSEIQTTLDTRHGHRYTRYNGTLRYVPAIIS